MAPAAAVGAGAGENVTTDKTPVRMVGACPLDHCPCSDYFDAADGQPCMGERDVLLCPVCGKACGDGACTCGADCELHGEES